MLKRAIATFLQVLICIRALDGCPLKHPLELRESLKDILQESQSAGVFVAGRLKS